MEAITFASVGAPATVTTEPIPEPGSGQVLVKTLYSAMNPIDMFSATTGLLVVGWPFTLGADGCGIVKKLGPDVPAHFQLGTTVFGCTRLGSPGHGTAASHYLMDTQVSFVLTPKMAATGLTPVAASTLGASILTACLGLFDGLHLPLSSLAESTTKETIVILGGASSVGRSAIQIARAAGHRVVVSCSPASGPLVERLGAEWFSYKDDVATQLKSIESITGASASQVHLIFDAVAADDPALAKMVFEAAGGSEKEKFFTTTNDWSGITDFAGGKTYCIELGMIGRPEDPALNAKLAEYITACSVLMEDGKLVAGDYNIMGEGISAGVEAYAYQAGGKAGSKKVVVKIGEE